MASSQPASKRQKTSKQESPYELLYWPGLPGRGEHIRLAFEESNTPYTDTAQDPEGMDLVLAQISPSNQGDALNPPICAPPILKHGSLIISQTPNILLYLGPKLGLVPTAEEDEGGVYLVNQLALTALDGLSNEPHDVHHPVASGLYTRIRKLRRRGGLAITWRIGCRSSWGILNVCLVERLARVENGSMVDD